MQLRSPLLSPSTITSPLLWSPRFPSPPLPALSAEGPRVFPSWHCHSGGERDGEGWHQGHTDGDGATRMQQGTGALRHHQRSSTQKLSMNRDWTNPILLKCLPTSQVHVDYGTELHNVVRFHLFYCKTYLISSHTRYHHLLTFHFNIFNHSYSL